MTIKRTSDGLSSEQYQDLTEKVKCLLLEESNILKSDDDLENFLKEQPVPNNQLLDNERIYYLLLNRLKNWVAREQAKQDGGSSWKRNFKKNPTIPCIYCGEWFDDEEEIVFHHELRDGRKPIPMHKECHDEHHRKKKNS